MLVVSACGRGARTTARQVPPPIDRSEPSAPPVRIADEREAPVDALAEALIEARQRSDHAEDLLDKGLIEEARAEFEQALEVLDAFSRRAERKNFRIEREIDFLSVRLETLEAAREAEKAAIDDLRAVETGEVTDPELRKLAAADVRETTYDLPIEINDRVISFLDLYTKGSGRRTIEVALERIGLYRPMIERILAEEGVPLDLIYLAQVESLFKPKARSRAQAQGMWQFISSRGAEYGLRQNWWIDERSDPEKSTRAAAQHLGDLYEQFGDWYLAMAAYNSGPGRVSRAMARTGSSDFWTLAGQRQLPRETRNYIPTILAMTIIGKNPTKYGFDVTPSDGIEAERVRVSSATDLRVIADYLDLPLDQLQTMNPHVLRWATPPDDTEFELNLPVGYAKSYAERIAPLPDDKRILFRHHLVSSGETLSHIARRYGVSISAITETNKISARRIIRIGQSLVIPISGITVPGDSLARVVGARPATPVAPPEVYRIRRGDTLSTIARRFGLSIGNIKVWNRMASNLLIAGESLVLTTPTATTGASAKKSDTPNQRLVYRVRRGDTLSKIALSHKTSVRAIREWNPESDLSIIRPGDQITIYMKR